MLNSMIKAYLDSIHQQALHRQRQSVNYSLVNFCSNDYLSLTKDPRIQNAFQRGFAQHPAGSGGSLVVCGYHPIHRELEQTFAQALGTDDALLFSSGYAANIAVVSLLARLQSRVLLDKGGHASFYDGIAATQIPYLRYRANDLSHLQLKLQDIAQFPKALLTESVFSMSGQMSDLAKISALCHQYQASCIVDEAHAFGVFGPEGLGAIKQFQLTQQDIPLRIIPFGKALGVQGAIVAGIGQWVDALLQAARSNIYSTAPSPALSYGLLESLSLLRKADDRRRKLFFLIDYFKAHCAASSLHWQSSSTPIQQLQLGCPEKALRLATYLKSQGIFCQAMRKPTVSKKETGLRIILNYHHEPGDIDALFCHLESKQWA